MRSKPQPESACGCGAELHPPKGSAPQPFLLWVGCGSSQNEARKRQRGSKSPEGVVVMIDAATVTAARVRRMVRVSSAAPGGEPPLARAGRARPLGSSGGSLGENSPVH